MNAALRDDDKRKNPPDVRGVGQVLFQPGEAVRMTGSVTSPQGMFQVVMFLADDGPPLR